MMLRKFKSHKPNTTKITGMGYHEKQFHVFLEYRNWLKIDDRRWKKRQSGTHENEITANDEAILPCPPREV